MASQQQTLAELGGDEPCSPVMLQFSYKRLQGALRDAQRAAFPSHADRWLELQHVDDLTRFLSRADNSVLSRSEVSKLGKALAAAQLAGHDARMDFTAPLKKSEEGVPDTLANAISDVQMFTRSLAKYGYRCRATAFLWG
uniref:Uncharacterized protein n=1 Tax=Pyrodinium bahamense TaxID=73915 RepID=A0A7S0B8N3_9DINO|mmetsp:Transcript_5476/g.15200  ORF Transcript_5476/g.15200 Transcript_5476/m.15200 type:complete len:140 (+) Transcript_5476:126-545(+)